MVQIPGSIPMFGPYASSVWGFLQSVSFSAFSEPLLLWGLSWGPSWPVLGLSWPVLGPSWAVLGPSWAVLGPSWAVSRYYTPLRSFGRKVSPRSEMEELHGAPECEAYGQIHRMDPDIWTICLEGFGPNIRIHPDDWTTWFEAYGRNHRTNMDESRYLNQMLRFLSIKHSSGP